jgi:hypothetical protein
MCRSEYVQPALGRTVDFLGSNFLTTMPAQFYGAEGLSPLHKLDYEQALNLFTKRRHTYHIEYRSSDGRDTDLGEKDGTGQEFKRTFDSILGTNPMAIRATVWPATNGKGVRRGPQVFMFQFAQTVLNGKDRFGFEVQPQQTNLGALENQIQIKEIRTEFEQRFQAERYENEKREWQRIVNELKGTIALKDREIQQLERENSQIHSKAEREFWGLSGKWKQGAQTVGGLLMGAFQKVFPNLSKQVEGGMEMALEGLTGIPNPARMEQLMAGNEQYDTTEEDGDDDETNETVMFPSEDAVELLRTFEEGDLKLMNQLILQIGSIADEIERRKLIVFACNFLGGKTNSGNKSEPNNPVQQAAPNTPQREKPKGFVLRRHTSIADDEELPPQEQLPEQPFTNSPSSQSLAQGFLDNELPVDDQ